MSYGRRRRAMGQAVRGRSRSGCMGRIVIALLIVGFAYFRFIASTDVVMNPYTEEKQRISLKPQEEIALVFGLERLAQLLHLVHERRLVRLRRLHLRHDVHDPLILPRLVGAVVAHEEAIVREPVGEDVPLQHAQRVAHRLLVELDARLDRLNSRRH